MVNINTGKGKALRKTVPYNSYAHNNSSFKMKQDV